MPIFTHINHATRRMFGKVRRSEYVVAGCGDSAGEFMLRMAEAGKKLKMRREFVWVHFERDEDDVIKRQKRFKKLAGRKNFFCEKLTNEANGEEFEKNLEKALDLYYDWKEPIESMLPDIMKKLSTRKTAVAIFVLGSGAHILSNIYLAKRILAQRTFSHTIALILEPEPRDVQSTEIYQKTISYLDQNKVFETHVIMQSKSVNNTDFSAKDNENIASLLSQIQKNARDNTGFLSRKKWWRVRTVKTSNSKYNRWFSKLFHFETSFEVIATAIDQVNNNGLVDDTSIYTFSGDLLDEEIVKAFSKLGSSKKQHLVDRQGNLLVKIRTLLARIRQFGNIIIGRWTPVSLAKHVDYTEFTELEFFMSKPIQEENDYYA
jgi:hypothetical protein